MDVYIGYRSHLILITYRFTQTGKVYAFVWKGLHIHNVPVKDIEFVISHCILKKKKKNQKAIRLSDFLTYNFILYMESIDRAQKTNRVLVLIKDAIYASYCSFLSGNIV